MDTEECVRDVRGQHLDRSRIMSAGPRTKSLCETPRGDFLSTDGREFVLL